MSKSVVYVAPCQHVCGAVVDDTEVVVESPHQKVGERAVTGCRSQWANQLVDMFAKVLVVTPKSMAGASKSELRDFEQ